MHVNSRSCTTYVVLVGEKTLYVPIPFEIRSHICREQHVKKKFNSVYCCMRETVSSLSLASLSYKVTCNELILVLLCGVLAINFIVFS